MPHTLSPRRLMALAYYDEKSQIDYSLCFYNCINVWVWFLLTRSDIYTFQHTAIGLLFVIIAVLWLGTQSKPASLSLTALSLILSVHRTMEIFPSLFSRTAFCVFYLTRFLDLAVHDTGLDKGDKIFIDGEGCKRGLCRCGCW
jgi:hypothetical protein